MYLGVTCPRGWVGVNFSVALGLGAGRRLLSVGNLGVILLISCSARPLPLGRGAWLGELYLTLPRG